MSDRNDEFDGRPDLVKKRARAILITRIGWTLAGLYIMVTLTLLGINAIQGKQTRGLLVDCVEPSGSCYKDGQKRTAEVVQNLIDANQLDEVATRRIVVVAAACSKDPENETLDDIQACVDKVLASDKKESGGDGR